MELTPEAAARHLNVPDYEEAITAKAGGLTNMVWGLVAAAIFLAYGTAERFVVPHGAYWVFGVVWIPFVAAGMAITSALWTTHAVSLARPSGGQRVKDSIIGTAVFALVAGAVVLAGWLIGGFAWNMHVLMLIANGVFCAVVATRVGMVCAPARIPGIVAGLIMVAGAVALGATDTPDAVAALAAALTAGAGWIGSGIATFRAG